MADKKQNSKFGPLALFVTAFIWGVAFIFQKRAMDYIDPFTFLAVRCTLATAFVALLLIVLKRSVKKAFTFSKETLRGGLICGVIYFTASALQQLGIVSVEAGKAGFLTALYIVLVPVLGIILFKEKPKLTVVIGVLAAVFGLYLLCMDPEATESSAESIKIFGIVSVGELLLILCALAFSFHIIACDRCTVNADAVQISFLQMAMSAVLNTICCIVFEAPSFATIKMAAGDLLYAGIASGGIAYTLQLVGQKYTEPTAASLIMSFESVFAVLGGWIILNEQLSGRELLGCVIMFVAIILVQINGKKNG